MLFSSMVSTNKGVISNDMLFIPIVHITRFRITNSGGSKEERLCHCLSFGKKKLTCVQVAIVRSATLILI